MKNSLLFLAFLTTLSLSAQVIDLDDATTRAVVVGISDYQDEHIPDLKYADRDAQAFAEFLRSEAGGSLGDKQLKVLVNEQATIGNMYDELDWLVAESKEGDRAIIYFSGHGDIEIKTLNQEGFLLCYNSPPHNYRTNAFAVYYLKDIVAQLTQLKKAKVVLITDACRAGKLAGSETGGSQATTAALKEQFAGEVKILSCQPNEFSMEGEGWGGGRGAFSFHLINGLYGKADRDKNLQVNLKEIWRYLDDRVPAETAPQTQNPMVVGDLEAMLAEVRQDLLAKVDSLQKAKPSVFSPGDLRGFEQVILAKADTGTQETYDAFLAALATGRLMFPKDSSANDYFEALINEPAIAEMHGFLKRKFVATLMDDAQKAMNGWLRSDPKEVESWGTNRKNDYLKFPGQLAKAAELLGKEHYLYNDLKAKEHFFKARIQIVEMGGSGTKPDSPLLPLLLQTVEEGLKYDSLAPYLYAKKSYYYAYKSDTKTAIECLKKAIELAPTWVQVYIWQTSYYMQLEQPRKALESAWQAYQLDSTNLMALGGIKWVYEDDHQFEKYKKIASHIVQVLDSSEIYHTKEMEVHLGLSYWNNGSPDLAKGILESFLQQRFDSASFRTIWVTSPHWIYNVVGWANYVQDDQAEAEKWWLQGDSISENSLAKSGLAMIVYRRGQFHLADEYLTKAMTVLWYNDPRNIQWDGLVLLGIYGRLEEAVLLFSKGIEHYPDNAPLHYHLARLHLEQKNDYEKGVPLLEKAVQLDSAHAYAHYHLAAAYAHLGKKQAALDYLEKALELGYEDFEQMEKDARWERLRKTKRYREILKKYLPEHHKD